MKWYEPLYIGESISHKVNKLKWKINHNAGTIGIYLITFPSNPCNTLDIIPSYELLQKGYPKRNIEIVGIAGSYEEAVDIVSKLVNDTYQQTTGVAVKEYLEKNRRRLT